MSKLVINADLGRHTISKHIYGHFAEHLGRCIYEGIWVGEDSAIPNTRGLRNDTLAALRALRMPNLRWPGGCFADTYHWRDGVGPRGERPSIVNVHWGGVTENNHFGTHEFMDLCAELDCEPYICGNVGSGTVQEMAEWLEYLTMPGQSPRADQRRANGRQEPWQLKYWGVGNENWGCGGWMRAEYYADLYRQYACFCRNFNGQPLYKVACGLTDEWNEILMKQAGRHMEGLSVHYYTGVRTCDKWSGSATQFGELEWYVTLQRALGIEDFIVKTETIMDRYDPGKRVGMIMDEWGTWFDVEPGTNPGFLYQQNTLRDALVAGLSLNIFNNHCERVHMANIAQTINVLQAMILTEGPRLCLTPTYHVFEMFKVHQDATLVPTMLECDTIGVDGHKVVQLSASTSRAADGTLHLSLCNLDPEHAVELPVTVRGAAVKTATGRVLTGDAMNVHNTFDAPTAIEPSGFDGFSLTADGLTVKLPPMSVVVLALAG